jgi:AraC-like DNA-binding protein
MPDCATWDRFTRRKFAEVDGLTSGLHGLVARGVPLGQGNFAGTLSSVDFGDFSLQVVRAAPVLLLGSFAEGCAGLMQMLDGSKGAHWNGRPVQLNQVAFYGDGRLHEAMYPNEFVCVVVSFATAGPGNDLDLPGSSGHGWPYTIVTGDPDPPARMAALARAVEQVAMDSGHVLQGRESYRSLRAAVFDVTRGLLGSDDFKVGGHGRHCGARQRIVHGAEEYLCANPVRPVYSDELCTALGVSHTLLHQAFVLTFGISPHRYLKMRRLSMVRAALLSCSGPWHSVKAAALSHGFWHLGQFARDYRAMYGELPSETLARVRPGSGGAEMAVSGRGRAATPKRPMAAVSSGVRPGVQLHTPGGTRG